MPNNTSTISKASTEPFEQRLLPVLERINRIFLASPSLEQTLMEVLDAMLDILDCDRAYLVYPCDPEAPSFTVPMERARDEWPGAGHNPTHRLPIAGFAKEAMIEALGTKRACRHDGKHGQPFEDDSMLAAFSVTAIMFVAIHPRVGPPWCLGIHHCGEPTEIDDDQLVLFEAVGARLADGLTGLLAYQASVADRRRLEHAQRMAQLGSYEWSREGGSYWSGELCRLLGLDPSRPPLTLNAVLQYLHEDDHERARSALSAAVDGGGQFEFRGRCVRPNGEEWMADALGQIVLGGNGQPETVLGVIQDVTERVRAEEHQRRLEAQLRQSQKMQSLGQLTGGVAHDFNNLLTVILGNLAELPNLLDDHDEVLKLVEEVQAAAGRAAELTRMLTAFSRKQPLKPQHLDVNSLLTGLEALLRRTLGESISIEVIRAAGLWGCEVDPAQLESALLNLVFNARDAMPTGGKLTIETANARVDHDYAAEHDDVQPGQYVLIAVTDGGLGMTEEILARAFEPFFTTKGPGRGTGLGLSMVYGFVKQSGGHIKLYSEPGEGTTSKIYLPRSTNSKQPLSSTPPSLLTHTGRGQLILVVEDERSVRNLVTRMLKRLGYVVAEAADADSAMALLNSALKVDLLLTDVVLTGGTDGAELARKAQALQPQLPVMFMSGYTENAIIHHGRLQAGVVLLEKPFTQASLAQRLKEAFESAS